MADFLAEGYLWWKALHLISLISWMAGMFYLPRLYVYHCQATVGSEQSETFKVMERKLLRIIINPAMICTFLFGGMLMFTPGVLAAPAGWFHAKFGLVLLMTVIHGMLAKWRKDFEKDQNTKSEKFYRLINEVPAVLMIGIVFLVVLKPF